MKINVFYTGLELKASFKYLMVYFLYYILLRIRLLIRVWVLYVVLLLQKLDCLSLDNILEVKKKQNSNTLWYMYLVLKRILYPQLLMHIEIILLNY